MTPHFPSYKKLMRQRGLHLLLESCRIEHAEGWKEVISWLSNLAKRYEEPRVKRLIDTYVKTITEHTGDAQRYARLKKEEVASLITPEFLSQRKYAIERSAVQKSLDFYFWVDPAEYDHPLSLYTLRSIRLTQMQKQWDLRELVVETRVCIDETKKIEERESLLRRRLFGSNWWMA